MNQSSLTSSEPIKGEVLRFSRWHTAAAAVGLSLAVVLGGEGIALITVATLLSPADTWFCYAIGVLGLVVAGGLLTGGCYLLTHKPSLVLGQDRLQLRLGKHLGWRVLYSDIAAIALFTPVHASGYRMPWTSSLGIQLSDPGAFDVAYPRLARSRARHRRRCGFDLSIPMKFAFEPPERCLEAVLRCYQAFKANQRELR